MWRSLQRWSCLQWKAPNMTLHFVDTQTRAVITWARLELVLHYKTSHSKQSVIHCVKESHSEAKLLAPNTSRALPHALSLSLSFSFFLSLSLSLSLS